MYIFHLTARHRVWVLFFPGCYHVPKFEEIVNYAFLAFAESVKHSHVTFVLWVYVQSSPHSLLKTSLSLVQNFTMVYIIYRKLESMNKKVEVNNENFRKLGNCSHFHHCLFCCFALSRIIFSLRKDIKWYLISLKDVAIVNMHNDLQDSYIVRDLSFAPVTVKTGKQIPQKPNLH